MSFIKYFLQLKENHITVPEEMNNRCVGHVFKLSFGGNKLLCCCLLERHTMFSPLKN